MAQVVRVRRANIPVAAVGNTVDFVGNGGDGAVTAAIIVVCGANTTNNPSDTANFGIGFWDNTDQRAAGIHLNDAGVSTASGKSSNDAYGLIIPFIGGGVNAVACTVSAVSNGIRLTTSEDNTSFTRYATAILFYGVAAKVITFTPSGSVSGTQASADLGFAPEAVFFTCIGSSPADVTAASNANLSFGVWRASDGLQRMVSFGEQNAVADGAPNILYAENRVVAQTNNDAEVWSGEITSTTGNTFTMTTRTGITSGDVCFAMALGSAVDLDFGTLTTPTSTGVDTISTTIDPAAVLLMLSTATGTTLHTDSSANGFMIGMADAAGQFSHNLFDEDAAATTNCGSVATATTVVDLDTSAAGARADLITATLSAFGTGNFALNYSAVHATARKGFWVALSSVVPPPGVTGAAITVSAGTLVPSGGDVAGIAIQDNFERSSVNVANSTVVGVGDSAVITLEPRLQESEVASSTSRWLTPLARIVNVNGIRPTFKFSLYAATDQADRFHQPPWPSGQRPYYTYDNPASNTAVWLPFDVNVTLSSTEVTFRLSTAFTANTVYVSRLPCMPVARHGAWITALEAASPSLIHTLSSTDSGFISDTYTAQTDELSRAIPAQPFYGFKVSDASLSPPGGEAKRCMVLVAGSHAGEDQGDFALQGAINFLLTADAQAINVRRYFDVFVYPCVNAPGRAGGGWRGSFTQGGSGVDDLNRHFSELSSGLEIVNKPKSAYTADLPATVQIMLDFHGNFNGVRIAMFGEGTTEHDAFETAAQAYFGGTFTQFGTPLSGFQTGWFKDFRGCDYAITIEIATNTPPTMAEFAALGENLMRTVSDLQDDDAFESAGLTLQSQLITISTSSFTPVGGSGGVEIPTTPTIGVATPFGSGSVSVAFTPGGGVAASSFTATSTPGGLTGTSAGSPIIVTGLTPGVSYTFTVHSSNGLGSSGESAASNSVTATRSVTLTLVDTNNSPRQNLTGLKWAFFEEVTPDLFNAPIDQGVAETTDGSGIIVIPVATSLTSGSTGWVTLTDSDGTATQSPPHKAFSGPVLVD